MVRKMNYDRLYGVYDVFFLEAHPVSCSIVYVMRGYGMG